VSVLGRGFPGAAASEYNGENQRNTDYPTPANIEEELIGQGLPAYAREFLTPDWREKQGLIACIMR